MVASEDVARLLNPFVLHLRKMELELNCPICLKFLNQPMLLPCNHLLCSNCTKTSTNDEFKCPDCRIPYKQTDLRPATHIEKFTTIYKNMSSAVSTLQQGASFGVSDMDVPSARTPISRENHAQKKRVHVTEEESFVDQGQISPPIYKVRDSDSDSWGKGRQLGVKRKFLDISSDEEANCGTKHARRNDCTEPKNDNLSMGGQTRVDLDGEPIETCVFCHSFKTTEATGDMLHFLNRVQVHGDQASQPKVIHVHRKCFDWSPQIYYSGETVVNLEVEILRSSKIKCSRCGLKGAALGCYEKSCRKSYHVPCAYGILQCRWDVENYLMLCPAHASKKLPCDNSKSRKTTSSSVEPLVSTDYNATSATKLQKAAWVSSSSLGKDWMICGSDLSKEEKVILGKFSGLSGLAVTYQWNENVTHVVAATNEDGACTRTIKFLMAILNGRWVLNMDWIKACLEARRVVPEKKYEITHDIHGCFDGPKVGRIQATQKASKLFDKLVFHFIGFTNSTYKTNLESLAIAGGGRVASMLELQNSSSPAAGETGKTFFVYCVEPLKDGKPMEIEEVLEIAKSVAVNAGVVRHTLFLNSIAAYDVGMLAEEICL